MNPLSEKKSVKFILCLAASLFSFAACVAQSDPEMEEFLEEFFNSETVFSQEKKEFQFTVKPQFARSEMRKLTIPLSIEYGITDRLQVEIEVPYVISSVSKKRSVRGVGNAQIGILYNIMNTNRVVSLSVGVEKSLHTSGKYIDAYEEEPTWEAFTVLARQFGIAQVHTNVAAELSDGEMAFHYAMATVFNLGRYKATFEVNSEKNEKRIFYYTPGLLMSLPNGIEMGMSVSGALCGDVPFLGGTALLTYEF
jgi:hypothetical protein